MMNWIGVKKLLWTMKNYQIWNYRQLIIGRIMELNNNDFDPYREFLY